MHVMIHVSPRNGTLHIDVHAEQELVAGIMLQPRVVLGTLVNVLQQQGVNGEVGRGARSRGVKHVQRPRLPWHRRYSLVREGVAGIVVGAAAAGGARADKAVFSARLGTGLAYRRRGRARARGARARGARLGEARRPLGPAAACVFAGEAFAAASIAGFVAVAVAAGLKSRASGQFSQHRWRDA